MPDQVNPYEIEIEIRHRKIKIDVQKFGEGLDLGQMAAIEQEFGVELTDIQGMSPQHLSAGALVAWIFGLVLPQFPDVRPKDVREISMSTINGWFEQVLDQLEEADRQAGESAPLDEGETPDEALTPGDPGEIPDDSGDRGWEPTSPSGPEISET